MTIFTGTTGDDSIVGTANGDDFHMEDGGADTVQGGDGIDVFYFGATLGAGDSIDGGAGNDFLVLDGDYSAAVDLGGLTLVGVETIQMAAGHSYDLTGFSNANLVSGTLKVDGSALGSGDRLTLDASGVGGKGHVVFDGGAGADSLTGGAGDDTLVGNGGADFLRGGNGDDHITAGVGDATLGGGRGNDTFVIGGGVVQVEGGAGTDTVSIPTLAAGSVIDGGDGDFDTIILTGNHQSYELDGVNVIGFERIGLGQFDHLTIDAAADPQGGSLYVAGSRGDRIDGHLVKGDLDIQAPGLHEVLIGGAGNDTINSGTTGDSVLTGGKGGDILTGGHGFGQHGSGSTFIYKTIGDSTVDNPDQITDLGNDQVIDLHKIDADTTMAGNQAFHLVSAFDGHAGELVVAYDSFRNVTNISADVDGDGQADMLITATGNHADFTGFTL